jgi:hypothetical protein
MLVLRTTSRSPGAIVMALMEMTFSHSLNGWLLDTSRDFRISSGEIDQHCQSNH